MRFVSLDFERMGEADIREEVLAPLIRHLGYISGSENDVIRELSLRYEMAFLGRKKPGKDPELRGRADYLLEVKNHARWVLEAKTPSSEIDDNSIEQSRSYANHPEVNAVYFGVSNGRKLLLFRTTAPPSAAPIYETEYAELEKNFERLFNIVGPDAIKRDFHDVHDVGRPLGPGLRSIAKIANGDIVYKKSSLYLPAILQLQMSIVDGTIERKGNNGLIAYIQTKAPVVGVQETIEKLGLDKIELISGSDYLSSNADSPTEFRYEGKVAFPEGERMFDVQNWSYVTLPATIICEVSSLVRGYLSGSTFSGTIENTAKYSGGMSYSMAMNGEFTVRLIQ